MTALPTLRCTPTASSYAVMDQSRSIYLLLEVNGGENAPALPVNLGLVIDSSDSMRIRLVSDVQLAQLARKGQAREVLVDGIPAWRIESLPGELLKQFPCRMDYAVEGLKIVGEYLRPTDRFSLVAFATQSVTVIRSSSGSERGRLLQIPQELEFLKLGDGTQMADGLALAFDELQCSTERVYANRMIVLTDGYTRNVNDCYAWAKKARSAGLTLSTMGIGNEFNEELLIPLADITGGNAYYIETPEQIPQAFRKELGAAVGVRYRNMEIKIKFPLGVGIRHAYRVFPELGIFDSGPDMGSNYSLFLGNYDPGTPAGLLLELTIPNWKAGNYRLAQTVLAWDEPHDSAGRMLQRQDIVIQMSSQATAQLNQRVMNIVEKATAFQSGAQAIESAQTGDPNATVRLRQAATRLLDMGETDLANVLNRQADTLEKSGSLDSDATKKLRYETRRLTQKVS